MNILNTTINKNNKLYMYKFLKYKLKCDNLIEQLGGNITNNFSDNLYLLFITAPLLEQEIAYDNKKRKKYLESNEYLESDEYPLYDEINKNSRIRKKSTRYKDYITQLTPALIKNLHFNNLKNFINDMEKDDIKIEKILEIEIDEDPDYVNYESRNFGKLVECWVADNMKCPCCEEYSLRRYKNDTFPLIDLICVNPYHSFGQGVKFFQVKSSNGSKFMNFPYFSLQDNMRIKQGYIHISESKLGIYPHDIKFGDDDLKKNILIGYICITHDGYNSEKCEKYNIINILLNNSFIVIPKTSLDSIKKKLFTDDNNNVGPNTYNDVDPNAYYYNYLSQKISPSKHVMIEFNNITNYVHPLDNFITSIVIPCDYVIKNNWIQINNPIFEMVQN